MSTPVKASALYGAKDLRVTERALRDPGPDEVQVAVKSTGLCGSDLHYFKHYRNGDILVREPITLGHESAGIVTAVGAGVGSLQLGDQVALEVGQPCEQCDLCTKGRYNICKGMRFRSSAKAFPHAQGTLQEEIIHPARYCHKLPPNVTLEQGALVEPLSVALHASDRAQLETGSAVLVIGAGTVGLLVAAICKFVTRGKVLLTDINHDRLIFARANNFADMCFTSATIKTERPDDQLANAKVSALEMTEDKWEDGTVVGEFDAVFECTGIESCLQTAIYATKPGGKVMLIGMGNPVQTLPISAAALREVDLIGVFRYANTYPRAIELLANHADELPDLSRLITHRFHGMENIPSAFEMAARTKDDKGNLVIKVNVTM